MQSPAPRRSVTSKPCSVIVPLPLVLVLSNVNSPLATVLVVFVQLVAQVHSESGALTASPGPPLLEVFALKVLWPLHSSSRTPPMVLKSILLALPPTSCVPDG